MAGHPSLEGLSPTHSRHLADPKRTPQRTIPGARTCSASRLSPVYDAPVKCRADPAGSRRPKVSPNANRIAAVNVQSRNRQASLSV